MNRILNERVKGMRLHLELPKTFWPYLIYAMAYLIILKLLEEAQIVKKVCLSHLKMFYCLSYVHIDDNEKYKLYTIKEMLFY